MMKTLLAIGLLLGGLFPFTSGNMSGGIVENGLALKEEQTRCLAAVIWHEARGEPLKGQLAVAQVVKNRVKSDKYPNTICKVAFQPHQFTDLKKIKYDDNTLVIAREFLKGNLKSPVNNATHYHADYVNPYWANTKKISFVGKVGRHKFYKASWI